MASAHRALKTDTEQLLRLGGKLHRQLVEHVLGIAVDDEPDGVLHGDAALVAVEKLVFGYLACGGFVLDDGRGVLYVHVGEGVGAAAVAQQEGVAGTIVAGAVGLGTDADEATVGVLAAARTDTLADDGAAGVAAEVYHLGARVGLLVVVGEGHAVELGLATLAGEDTTGVLPRDGAARLHLRPRQAAVAAAQMATLGDEVQHAAAAVLVAGIPVLDRAVLDLGVVHHHDFHNGRVELVFVAHGGGAAFEVGDVGIVVADDERALKLPCSTGVDAEIGAQFHGTAHALGDVDEGAVGKDSTVEGGEEVIAIGDDGAEIGAHEVGVVADGLADGAEDDALLLQTLAESGLDRHAVHDGVDGHAAEGQPLLEGNAQFVKGFHQLRVYLSGAVARGGVGRRVGVVGYVLIVYRGHVEMGPCGRLQCLPVAESTQTEVEQPLGFAFLGGYQAHDVLGKSLFNNVGAHVGREAVFVGLVRNLTDDVHVTHLKLKVEN